GGVGRRAVALAPGDELIAALGNLRHDVRRVRHLTKALTVGIDVPSAATLLDARRAVVEEIRVERRRQFVAFPPESDGAVQLALEICIRRNTVRATGRRHYRDRRLIVASRVAA